jgi:hypothetical protein
MNPNEDFVPLAIANERNTEHGEAAVGAEQ